MTPFNETRRRSTDDAVTATVSCQSVAFADTSHCTYRSREFRSRRDDSLDVISRRRRCERILTMERATQTRKAEAVSADPLFLSSLQAYVDKCAWHCQQTVVRTDVERGHVIPAEPIGVAAARWSIRRSTRR